MKMCKECLVLIMFASVPMFLAGCFTVFILHGDIVCLIDKIYGWSVK